MTQPAGPTCVRITLGRAALSPVQAGALRVGDVIELDESHDSPVHVHADGQFVGEGEAVDVAGRLAVTMRRKRQEPIGMTG